MKKLLMLLCAMTMAFGMVGNASALSFTHTVGLGGVILAEGPVAGVFFPNTHSYSHATPSGLTVPYDTVLSATLTVSGYYIDGGVGGGDTVALSESVIGTLTPGGTWWSGPSTSMFDISPSFSTWSGGPLGVTITAAGDFWDGIIKLSSSTLDLSWTDGTDPGTAPVPEPATILLMGTGLLGLVAYSRKRFSKKS
jgi:hypothetical protein